MREAVYVSLCAADWSQTRYIVQHPNIHYEKNSHLGRHPSASSVDAYFIASVLFHGAVSAALPPKWRGAWQYISIGYQVSIVEKNHRIGIRFHF